ncbi:hypothetical protein L0U85_13375 [Glycomyces sp. L485]|uniref:hypothetical protein n=1 Tax=Glycomyces sp. L485 TaxID=2909235 RepID=UPI001F4A3C2F|nr:hypothetical protein [Glycomyces sp. L485]MCH7231836.1 hypothetical protein [Glycomyces sp. L485]
MDRDERFRQHARALLNGEGQEAQRIADQFTRDDHGAHFIFIGALFTRIVLRHFGTELHAEELQRFMSGVRQDFQTANPPLNSLHVEGMIRSIYGEDQFLQEVPAGEQSVVMWAVMRKITDQTVLGRHLEQLFGEAEELAERWIAEGAGNV